MIDRIKSDPQALAAAEAGNWQACADRLNAIAEPTPKPAAVARADWNRLQDLFGVDRVVAWRMAIQAAEEGLRGIANASIVEETRKGLLAKAEGLKLFFESMGTRGYPFDDVRTIAQLEKLNESGIITDDDLRDLKAIGWNEAAVTTADECSTAWQAYSDQRQEQRQAAARSAIVATLRRLANRFESESTTVSDQLRTEIVDEIDANWPEL